MPWCDFPLSRVKTEPRWCRPHRSWGWGKEDLERPGGGGLCGLLRVERSLRRPEGLQGLSDLVHWRSS